MIGHLRETVKGADSGPVRAAGKPARKERGRLLWREQDESSWIQDSGRTLQIRPGECPPGSDVGLRENRIPVFICGLSDVVSDGASPPF